MLLSNFNDARLAMIWIFFLVPLLAFAIIGCVQKKKRRILSSNSAVVQSTIVAPVKTPDKTKLSINRTKTNLPKTAAQKEKPSKKDADSKQPKVTKSTKRKSITIQKTTEIVDIDDLLDHTQVLSEEAVQEKEEKTKRVVNLLKKKFAKREKLSADMLRSPIQPEDQEDEGEDPEGQANVVLPEYVKKQPQKSTTLKVDRTQDSVCDKTDKTQSD